MFFTKLKDTNQSMSVGYLDPVTNINNILSQASGDTVVSRERLNLTDIGDPDDREFARLVIDTLLNMEPGNPDLLVRINTDHPIYLIWVQGLKQTINNGHFRMLYDLRHPVPGFQAVGNIQIYPAKGMQPMKFCVEVNPYGPKRALKELYYRESRSRYSKPRALPPSDPMYTAHRHSRHRSISPKRRRSYSRSPTVRHFSRSVSRSPSRSSSKSPSPEKKKSVLGGLLSWRNSSSSRRRK